MTILKEERGNMFKRTVFPLIKRRMQEPRRLIQIVSGPRQIGKTTTVRQALQECSCAFAYHVIEGGNRYRNDFISSAWNEARLKIKSEKLSEFILVFDEIQNVPQWSSFIKKEWDTDSFDGVNIKVFLLGSSRVLLLKGLAESLMGRFEIIRMSHWSYLEMKNAFNFSVEDFVFFGGYPLFASLMRDNFTMSAEDKERNAAFLVDAIINATVEKDILIDTPIAKPALLRRLVDLACNYSGEIISLNKLLGCLQEKGNTSTLANYLDLLEESGLIGALSKFSIDRARLRASPPKLQVWNNALKTNFLQLSYDSLQKDKALYGRVFESAIGAFLVSASYTGRFEVFYWREGDLEVDYVLKKGERIVAIEVKSNFEGFSKGLNVFNEKFKPYRSFIIGPAAMKAEEFFSIDPIMLFD